MTYLAGHNPANNLNGEDKLILMAEITFFFKKSLKTVKIFSEVSDFSAKIDKRLFLCFIFPFVVWNVFKKYIKNFEKIS